MAVELGELNRHRGGKIDALIGAGHLLDARAVGLIMKPLSTATPATRSLAKKLL